MWTAVTLYYLAVKTDSGRHQRFEFNNIPKTEGGQIHLNFVTVFWSRWNQLTQKGALLERKYFSGSIPLLTPTTVLWHVAVLCISPLWQFFRIEVISYLIRAGLLNPENPLGVSSPTRLTFKMDTLSRLVNGARYGKICPAVKCLVLINSSF